MSAGPEIRILEDSADLAREAADLFIWIGEQALAGSGCYRVALSGGRTPRDLYTTLTSPAFAKQLDWPRVQFYFGDERCVQPDHQNSNFAMADAALFRPLGIAASQIFRMRGETEPTDAAAAEYEMVLRRGFGDAAGTWPSFDLILLGLGEDGHTASLFPGTSALEQRTRWVTVGAAPTGVPKRLTLTLPVLNQARTIVFLVSGTAKAATVRSLLEAPERQAGRYPAGLIRPQQGRLIWLLDRPAASDLTVIRQQLESHEE